MKRVNKILVLVTLVCIALLIWFAAFSGDTRQTEAQIINPPQPNAPCNTLNVAGTYAYAGFGTIYEGNLAGFPAGQYNTAASLKLDGGGNYTVKLKTSYNGTIVDEQFAGSYTVDANCGVTFLYNGIPSVYAVFTNNRREARGISTIPGTNVTFLTVGN